MEVIVIYSRSNGKSPRNHLYLNPVGSKSMSLARLASILCLLAAASISPAGVGAGVIKQLEQESSRSLGGREI